MARARCLLWMWLSAIATLGGGCSGAEPLNGLPPGRSDGGLPSAGPLAECTEGTICFAVQYQDVSADGGLSSSSPALPDGHVVVVWLPFVTAGDAGSETTGSSAAWSLAFDAPWSPAEQTFGIPIAAIMPPLDAAVACSRACTDVTSSGCSCRPGPVVGQGIALIVRDTNGDGRIEVSEIALDNLCGVGDDGIIAYGASTYAPAPVGLAGENPPTYLAEHFPGGIQSGTVAYTLTNGDPWLAVAAPPSTVFRLDVITWFSGQSCLGAVAYNPILN